MNVTIDIYIANNVQSVAAERSKQQASQGREIDGQMSATYIYSNSKNNKPLLSEIKQFE